MTVRTAAPADHEAIRAVVDQAFGRHEGIADLVEDLRSSGRVEVELVADDAGEVVGHVCLERAWVDDDDAVVDVLTLSPLSVAPGKQGTGIGTRLIAAALGAARDRDEPYVFLEGAPGYYGDRGFGPALERGFLRPSDRIPGAAFQVAVLDDRGVTGRLVYPDAFWRHGAVGLRGETLAQVRAALGE
ncbi:MAG: GNAT family N-acetyltransferase [Nocardioides sp.]